MTITYKTGDKDTRPWGTWEVLDTGNKHIVKRIQVMPQKMLSLQMHHHRSEHWIITDGTAEITLGDTVQTVSANNHVFIPVGCKHRIANRTASPVIFIEIQAGDLLDENDIVRFEDQYGRV